MSHHILLATWDESSKAKALDSFTQLKNQYIKNIHEVTIVERQADGSFKILNQVNPDQDNGIWSGSLVGFLIGILGGPLGIVVGLTAGALIGSTYDIDHEKEDLAVLGRISTALPIGTIGVIVDIFEESEQIVDDFFQKTNATLYRWDYDEVEAEIEATAETWEETSRLVNLSLKEKKKEEFKEIRKQKWEKFKAQFHKTK